MERCNKGRSFPVSIVIADLNGLKQVNDHHGHEAGDRLIKQIAEVLRVSFRGGDVVARIGGDKFAAIIYHTSQNDAKEAITRIYLHIANINIGEPLENTGHLSLALGVAEATNRDELKSAIKLADEAMYEDKRRQKAKKS
jgi:diguanylate cyclase (GGDEF)-like protein